MEIVTVIPEMGEIKKIEVPCELMGRSIEALENLIAWTRLMEAKNAENEKYRWKYNRGIGRGTFYLMGDDLLGFCAVSCGGDIWQNDIGQADLIVAGFSWIGRQYTKDRSAFMDYRYLVLANDNGKFSNKLETEIANRRYYFYQSVGGGERLRLEQFGSAGEGWFETDGLGTRANGVRIEFMGNQRVLGFVGKDWLKRIETARNTGLILDDRIRPE